MEALFKLIDENFKIVDNNKFLIDSAIACCLLMMFFGFSEEGGWTLVVFASLAFVAIDLVSNKLECGLLTVLAVIASLSALIVGCLN